MDIMPPAAHDAQPPRPFRDTHGTPETEARARCAARRARVLAHPDIARRLCNPPMNYPAPEYWTGYIPPARIDSGQGEKPNTSPIRQQLLDIVYAVAEREAERDGEATA